MANLSDADVQAIIAKVKGRVAAGDVGGKTGAGLLARSEIDDMDDSLGEGVYATVDEAVGAATRSFARYQKVGLDGRKEIIEAIRQSMRENNERLAYMARQETGLGRADDKVLKNHLVIERTPGPEDLEPHVVTGDNGMMVTEYAPYGVIGSISPTTNPTSTIINNAIAILSAGNSATFNVHPSARGVSIENVKLINRAVVAAGGPADLVTSVAKPTLDSAQALMSHPDVRVLLVTGGPGVVKAALKTPKKAITAGPGNPPAVVDQTADIAKAARDIVTGASFDNNIICVDEKTTIVVDSIADRLIQHMAAAGGYRLKEHELKRLERVIFSDRGPDNKPGVMNHAFVGKDASVILNEIGVSVPPETRLILAEVPVGHNLVWTEQMMPVMPVVRVKDVDTAIDLAVRSEHGFRHTASIHSTNVDTITRMARSMDCSIFVANGSNIAGLGAEGEGYTSFSIASPTGEGLTRPRTFSRIRRVSVVGALRIV
ncbi:MAG: aldehyde dehydrogenase EutE [Actinomycetia bacterium]|nr:aldehyde dehydrogenase EutE [Actinomycetes bacterium]